MEYTRQRVGARAVEAEGRAACGRGVQGKEMRIGYVVRDMSTA